MPWVRRRRNPPGPYAASLRWRASSDPSWEVEFDEGGFISAEDAALFASGYGVPSVTGLRLIDRCLYLVVSDDVGGRHVADAEVVAWRAPEGAGTSDSVPCTMARLREALAPDEIFVPLGFHVTGPRSQRLDVSVEQHGINVIVTVAAVVPSTWNCVTR
jgi:hypothetical protein